MKGNEVYKLLTARQAGDAQGVGVFPDLFAQFFATYEVPDEEAINLNVADGQQEGPSTVRMKTVSNYIELQTIVRQKTDPGYGQHLNTLRIGLSAMTDENHQYFRNRLAVTEGVIAKELNISVEEVASTSTIHKIIAVYNACVKNDPERKKQRLILVTHNDVVDAINRQLLDHHVQATGHRVETIEATNNGGKTMRGGNGKAIAMPPRTKTGGLQQCLRIAVGCQVMVTRNLRNHTVRGLFNGLIGHVTSRDANCIYVKFPKFAEPIAIERDNTKFTVKGQSVMRVQFPLTLAWAVTIHKAQGSTVDEVITSSEGVFSSGAVYVAYGRTRHSSGLFLVDYNIAAIRTSIDALKQYNLMRATVPGLAPYPIPTGYIGTTYASRRNCKTDVGVPFDKRHSRFFNIPVENGQSECAIALLQMVVQLQQDNDPFWEEVRFYLSIFIY